MTPNDAMLAELGVRLARLRKQRGLTQEVLAAEAGLGVATLRRIEDGSDGKLGSWLRLLKALDLVSSIEGLLPEDLRSPMAEAQKRGRRRASDAGFVWGDERE